MGDVLIFGGRQRAGCSAIEVYPDRCNCSPVVYVTTELDHDELTVGVPPLGWRRRDFARLVGRWDAREA
jgi:hypothetical protein